MKNTSILLFFIILLLGCVNNSSKKKSLAKNGNTAFVRNAHSMAYDFDKSLIYLFGGANEKEVLSDLWVLEGTHWRRVVTKDKPEPRTFASMIYDNKNSRLLLFGGSKVLFGKEPNSQNLLNDIWQFKNNQWKKLTTNNAPSPRAEAAMAYDENRETVILFGGYYIHNGEYIKLGDTWEFHHNDWHLVSKVGPSKRHGVSMTYNSEDNSIVLFGGSTTDKQYGKSKGETWKWNGEKWNKLDIKQPAGIFNASIAYDNENKEFIRFGGWNGNSRINETWSLRNNKWNKIETKNSPAPRNHSKMVYDVKNKRIVLFGGHDGENVFGDIWELKNLNWNRISESQVIKRIENSH